MFGRTTLVILFVTVAVGSVSHAQQLDPRRYSQYQKRSYLIRGYIPGRRQSDVRRKPVRRVSAPIKRTRSSRVVRVNNNYQSELSRAKVFQNPYERSVPRRRATTRYINQRPLATTRPSIPPNVRTPRDPCPPGTTVYRGRVAPPRSQYKPVVTFTRMPSKYYVGRGIIGQPKVYVPGQPIRNFFRYISP